LADAGLDKRPKKRMDNKRPNGIHCKRRTRPNLFIPTYGTVIFPDIGKDGFGVGGAGGKGTFHQNGNAVTMAALPGG